MKNMFQVKDYESSGIISDHSLLQLDISAIEQTSESTSDSSTFQCQILEKLKALLNQIKISDEDEVKESLKLFLEKQFSELENIPSKKYREKFKQELNKLIQLQ